MSEGNETHAEIIGEMRIFKCRNLETGELEECTCISQYLANRLEAAHKREIEDAERRGNHAATKAICDTLKKIGPLYDAESVGNAAKLREALEEIRKAANVWIMLGNISARRTIEMIFDIACGALAEPPRNCDVGSARDQSDRLHEFCHAQKFCDRCPCQKPAATNRTDCHLLWAQMPYEKGGAA